MVKYPLNQALHMNGDHMVTLGEILKKMVFIDLNSTNGIKSTQEYSRSHQICFIGHKISKFDQNMSKIG